MTFNSLVFLLFYPVVLAGYWLCRRIGGKVGRNMAWVFLLAASYFFYMYSQWKLVGLIRFTTLVSWLCSLAIENINLKLAKAAEEGEPDHALIRRAKAQKNLCLILTLVASLGVLFYFKYVNFILGTASSIAGWFGHDPGWYIEGVLLPVGISFYTFQTLSYAIDVYRGSIKTERHFGYYALFVSFFPQLVAGPIERPGNLLPQLKEFLPVGGDDVRRGLHKIALGFFKKIAVADLISVYVNRVYNGGDIADLPALAVVLATLLFSVQIYCDFSGYTDIAIGCARLMGIRLMKNFDHPYIARTVREFWGRWHISLSTWFRDYIYFPLGGSRCARWKHLRNVAIVFLISGLWHGAAWTFVIWGGLHAVYQIVGILTLPARDRLLSRCRLDPKGKAVGVVRTILTFVLVTFAWLFFRANSTADMILLLRVLFSPDAWRHGLGEVFGTLGMTLSGGLLTAASVVWLVLLDRVVPHGDEPDATAAPARQGVFILAVWAVFFAWTWLMKNDLTSTFIYFQF
ncbi:MAG: MBOAT family protein [Clostridia bacterium]|nr:MBOAT family protein [Clostridia bacterium]